MENEELDVERWRSVGVHRDDLLLIDDELDE